MLTDRLETAWIDAFSAVFELCKIRADEQTVILSETQSRPLTIRLAELSLNHLGLSAFHLQVPTPFSTTGPLVRSTGASLALTGQKLAVETLAAADVVIDLTVEGLMHARETAAILKGGARIITVSNEHPEALARLVPTADMKERAKDAVARCRAARIMSVRTEAGTDLEVRMEGATTVGVWGWTDRPGTLAHWPGGVVVSFPGKGSVNGRLAYQPGDINLTFKRYFETTVNLQLDDDYVTRIDGNGADARLMRSYLESFSDKEAYATSHVGWGLNPAARYEALTMYDQRDTNGTELRTLAGNFLYSTGANEFAGRFTSGHFDLPMMNCDITLDGSPVVARGKLL